MEFTNLLVSFIKNIIIFFVYLFIIFKINSIIDYCAVLHYTSYRYFCKYLTLTSIDIFLDMYGNFLWCAITDTTLNRSGNALRLTAFAKIFSKRTPQNVLFLIAPDLLSKCAILKWNPEAMNMLKEPRKWMLRNMYVLIPCIYYHSKFSWMLIYRGV